MLHSTRGKDLVSSPQAILNGLAPDGGLYVIDKVPSLDYHTLMNDDYKTMAAKILQAFFEEFTFEEIKKEVDEAYSSFDIDEVVRLHSCDRAYFLELFHGPTLAFKDLALVVLPRLMRLSKEKLGYEKNITILTATSGDTGGAALNGFKGIDGVSIVVLYPNGGVSPIQEAQMLSFRAKNAKVLAVQGNFDDCQSLVKEFFHKHRELSLSSANSINIARLIPQVVYYFYSYIELVRSGRLPDGEEINFDVPTGNFGNIFAGYYAKMMGLPIHNLICASNKNSVLTDFFHKGAYDKNRPFYRTNSPSMDILISSNLERLVYYGTGENPEEVNALMESLKNSGEYPFKNPFDFFKAYSTGEEKTLEIIRDTYEKYKYLIDPHTAVAYNAYLEYQRETKDNRITVVVSTASPYKFPQAVLEAFDIQCANPSDAVDMLSKKFGIEIPKVLNYPEIQRETISLAEAEEYIVDVIRCFM